MYYLGIDGGGTKTAFEIINGNGNILSSLKTETCNYIQIGKEKFGKVIREGVAAVCDKAEIQTTDLCFTCIGIPSFGEISTDTSDLISIAKEALHSNNIKCVNDVEVAWAGSLACNPGINLLAGTGALGYGKDQKNNAVRVGGWGYFCGDEGSAYWLGKKLIELFTKEADGRIAKGKTYDIVCREFNLNSDFDFISVIYNKLKFKRNEIAKLQLLLNKAADQGDSYAVNLYKEAAYELNLVVAAIIDKLDFDAGQSITVSYSGGVFKAGNLLLDPLKEYVSKYNITFKEPQLSPVSGAALYALMSHCNRKGNDIIENLQEQDKHI